MVYIKTGEIVRGRRRCLKEMDRAAPNIFAPLNVSPLHKSSMLAY